MKLQHTSGAVIENDLLKEAEGLYPAFVQYDAFDKVVAKYPKSDWKRVPEERWEKAELTLVDLRTVRYEDAMGRISFISLRSIHPDKYIIIDGNLCVERRVEG